MGWAKSPHICEPLQPLLYWLMLRWLVPPCVLAGVNGFCGGTDFANSAYLGRPRFIVASTVSGMVEDGHSTSDALTPLARSSNHLPLTYSRVYCDGGCCDVDLGCRVLTEYVTPLSQCAAWLCWVSKIAGTEEAGGVAIPISLWSAKGRVASIMFCSFLAFALSEIGLRPMSRGDCSATEKHEKDAAPRSSRGEEDELWQSRSSEVK